jgi:Tfp pilus assembly PilM family ATPase
LSRYLALDAEQGQVYLASAIVKGAAVKLEKAVCAPSEGLLTAANAAEFGRRLKEVLKEAGIAPAPVLVSVGRERVVLKEVKFPASVSAAEEPALVRFQVAKELSETGDNVVIDYFTLPALDPDGQRRALAFAIRKDVLAPLRSLCQAAGLKLAGVTPRPFGIAASLMRAVKDGAVTAPESLNAPIAILVRGDKWGELVILRDGQVAFTRSLSGMGLKSE